MLLLCFLYSNISTLSLFMVIDFKICAVSNGHTIMYRISIAWISTTDSEDTRTENQDVLRCSQYVIFYFCVGTHLFLLFGWFMVDFGCWFEFGMFAVMYFSIKYFKAVLVVVFVYYNYHQNLKRDICHVYYLFRVSDISALLQVP